jgi:uncharacterized protein YndB with AHSA1/START domain
MNRSKLEITARIQIQKPAGEVFEAIVDPRSMSNYFISEGSGRMIQGSVLTWKFPEFDGAFPIRIGRVDRDGYISFFWDSGGRELMVEIFLKPMPDNSTLVTVTEKSMPDDEAGLKWLMGNTEGWANFLACLKAWMEYGINLRKGAFDFLKKNVQ